MKTSRWRLAVFALVCAGQLAVAASILFGSERVLGQGELWRFRTAPVDPADIVRGRYVALRFEATSGPAEVGATFAEGDLAYALLEADEQGFARVPVVQQGPPATGDYLTVRVKRESDVSVDFEFPVDRFYLPEEQAPEAERAYRDSQSSGRRDSWADIRVYQGQAVIEQLYIGGVPAGQVTAPEPTDAPAP